ncbi:MAG: hypothetical protein RLZZ584_10 [Pseudomonadota bacterium]
MADPTTLARRRRAACAVLEGVLGDDELLAALWLQHDSMVGEAVSDIIRYVDAVAERHQLDAGTRKRLYDALHRALRRSDAELPIDPWPAMLAVRPVPAPVATPRAVSPPMRGVVPAHAAPVHPAPYPPPYPQPYPGQHPGTYPGQRQGASAAPVYPPAYPTGQPAAYPPVMQTPGFPQSYPAAYAAPVQPPAASAAAMLPESQPVATAGQAPAAAVTPSDGGWTPESGVPAEQAVFAALVGAIADAIAQTHPGDFDDWRGSWLALLKAQKKQLPAELQARLVRACGALAPTQDAEARRQAWQLALPARQLAEQVHQLYVALCEALGPVSADQVLTRAVRQVESTPPARLFSPRKLL